MNSYLTPSKSTLYHKPIFAWLIAASCYFGLYGTRLQFPNETYYDEVYFVKTAQQIIHLNGYTDTVQPPFGKLLIALGILIFGDHSWVWRLVPLLSGFGCLVMLYVITKSLTSNARIAFFSALLFAMDGVSFTQARIGMLNAPMLFFMFLSVWCLMKHTFLGQWPRPLSFFLSGICFGLATATRLIGFSIFPILFMFYWKLWRQEKNRSMLLKESCFFFILVSFFVYESTYLIIPFIKGFDWSLIWKLQISMVKYHLTLTKTHTYGSEWWMWPLMKRPIWYYYHAGWVNGVNRVRGILCIGNPLIFWFMPLAVGFAVREFVNKRNDILMFVIVGFFTQWLQWAPVIRVKFFHYIYTAMPFAEIAFAILLERLWRKGSLGRGAVIGYLVLVTLMFFYWFPLYNGFPITKAFFRQHMWFRSWI